MFICDNLEILLIIGQKWMGESEYAWAKHETLYK